MRTTSPLELFLPLAARDQQPLHHALEQELREAVRSGRLAPESALPSTRALAEQLGVSRGVVVEAYEQLVAEGYLISRTGSSTRVARVPRAIEHHAEAEPAARYEVDFRPGRPDLNEFPRAAWMRSVRRVLNEAPADRFGYLDGRGMPELRVALAAYVNRVRGTNASPSEVVITSGYTQGLRLVAQALRQSGRWRIGVEDPSHSEYWSLLREVGFEVVGIPVDAHGLRVDRLEQADVDALVLTPAHQYPTGAVLPPERRAGVLAWADRRDATIIEDDYDAEFRYDREPIGAMQGLCADRVVYAGTASKTLVPGLRLGWLAVPPRLVEPLAEAKKLTDAGSSALDQMAFADFVQRGELDRHLRRMRLVYRQRRDALMTALDRHLPRFTVAGASAGLHVLAWLPANVDEAWLVSAAAAQGIGLRGVAPLRLHPHEQGGIVFGYGSIDERRLEEGVRRLADIAEGTAGRMALERIRGGTGR